MNIEKIYNFFENATKSDIIITISLIVIALATIFEIFSIERKVRQIYKMQKNEFTIIAKEFARIAPNHYITNYATDTNDEKETKMESL